MLPYAVQDGTGLLGRQDAGLGAQLLTWYDME